MVLNLPPGQRLRNPAADADVLLGRKRMVAPILSPLSRVAEGYHLWQRIDTLAHSEADQDHGWVYAVDVSDDQATGEVRRAFAIVRTVGPHEVRFVTLRSENVDTDAIGELEPHKVAALLRNLGGVLKARGGAWRPIDRKIADVIRRLSQVATVKEGSHER